MADRHDYVALEWVKGEIAETLKLARQALEAFVANPHAPTAMLDCLSYVHQVHGSLQMIEFYGAALLAEEIEQLAMALQQGRAAQQTEAVQLLLQAITQLPLYLDRIHSARRDLPLLVLPLLNDLRSARGESLLSETSLFTPQLLAVPELDATALAALDSPDLMALLRKLRQMLQTALVGLLREQEVQTNLGYMAKVFARLEALCENAPLGPLWQIASALVETMADGHFTNSPALRGLLKESDKELKRLLEQGISGINQPAPDELLKSLLFYIAKSDSQAPQMLVLKEQYGLDEALPDAAMVDEERARLAGPDRDAMRSVVVALCEELVRVKERLDGFVRSDRKHVGELSSLLPPLRQIADTLAVLGFGQPRKVIIDQLAVVQRLAQGQSEADDSALMDVAGALLYVEATLAGMVGPVEQASHEESHLPTTDLTQIHQLVIKEARVGLQQAKDMIIDYIDGSWDRDRLQALPGLLVQVRGALAMIPLARAASLLAACNDYIQSHLLMDTSPPTWPQLDGLADALTSIEYYLERLGEDHEAPGEQVLDMAQLSLTQLGYSPIPNAAMDVPLLEEVITQDELLEMNARQALVSSTLTLAEVLASPVLAVNPPAQHVPTSLLPPPADEERVDDELLEVFLEETDEMLAALHAHLPQWFKDTADTAALTEVRRAFHTLKGSGRMVRALILGELAWSVENLLNRVVEHSVQPDQDVQGLLSDVLVLLPAIIREFADNVQRQRDDVDLLAARAHAMAKRERVMELPVETPGTEDGVSETLDPQLLEIFRQEARSHLDTLDSFLRRATATETPVISDALQRALHTLKGSAYMAGVVPIAELASPLDQLVREFKANLIPLGAAEIQLLRAAEPLFNQGLMQLGSEPLATIPGAEHYIADVLELLQQRLKTALSAPNSGLRLKRNPQLIASFLAQGMDILLDAESLLQRWREHPGERQELSALLDELTTLGHGAHLADLPQVDELCEALLDLYGAVEESSLAVSERFFEAAASGHEALIDMLDQVAAGQEVHARPEHIQALRELLDQALDPSAMGVIKSDGSSRALSITELNAATERLATQVSAESLADEPVATQSGIDDEIVEIFLEEAVDILDSAGHALRRWLDDPENPMPLSSLQRDLHTLKGGARMAEIQPVGDLGHELETLYEGLIDRRFSYSPEMASLLQRSHDLLAVLLEQLQAHQPLTCPARLIESIRAFRQDNIVVQSLEPETKPAKSAVETLHESDPELLEIFLEEGFDIIESSGSALARWQDDPTNTLEVENLLRDLHTLKGGARMVEITPIGDLAHELEFLYEGLAAGVLHSQPLLISLLQSGHDFLADMLDAVRVNEPLPSATLLIDSIHRFSTHSELSEASARVEPGAVLEPALQVAPSPEPETERTPPEMVKVAAEQLESLVNLAGETSIFRGRIEQQVTDVEVTLAEMETTIERMRDQLRRLDIETQGRILSREQVQAERLGYEEFDPLEMDRHSQLQQLSRALFESASDLLDLKETLHTRNQDAQRLLSQQARVNTELQEGLMRTRMVPFERLLPRLRRIVRQVAGELDKQVNFDVGSAEGEMDRSVLERMVAPLEHMLRNAVDHGLESAEERLAAGKPEEGTISLSLIHEGGDIVIEMRDDGAGVDLDAVRRKAIKRGLIDASAELSDYELLQFILQAGFSTAEKVTQISGRGVGMDVVHAEVKQLGGSMIIDSKPGQGTRFQIRLPVTVSVNRALMVQCGDEQYAVPLNTVGGIVRVMPHELEACYQSDPPRYQFSERSYELRYLGELLNNGLPPKLLGQTQPLPVLLVHVHDHWVAVQVDALAGSREIVVKSLGAQFSGLQGISGATILGDGRVVFILDLLTHIRSLNLRLLAQQAAGLSTPKYIEMEQARPVLVMVVDDSVTVRKVTSRLLERNGMNVLTAKDGVDAMALLQEHTPDVLLLDIEMPRMDGFEVASRIRADQRLKELPIIMITSRSGQKHRDHAMTIGVNDYLSKPYQESVLLESIAQWSQVHV
ncbi:Hpt domain-containing protein [Pseudomonas sp. CCI3.2]|uniref:Hpt domain-containing protein n=1 Tax=unclassified Pseudomonas TaxID=196821 RepID=UPI002AC8D5FE|nr:MULTISPECIES: Hpt domain-containing protein [unclassified Pseudomonas]MEB0079288.1 Hpt domain-containing protein [Pseudomonas sp. MH10out]MEB0092599.1 Hpt domain-containing protein [Pseudomonas sp. CCI4.2]MEB0102561.1 Hpt domain-containing protein [Pseudomonas sp. CCI3.2]MEB0119153.1 Hpt domain-containing protein [Pseudomonas sp. CCI1.2]MEB0132958.1 Hpt domain-containing protein [Pseudomonas sp. CCI2.4]